MLAALARKHGGVRVSYGWIMQHLMGGPQSVTYVARALGISQQAVSKSLRELERLGYVKESDGEDGRARYVALTARGQDLVAAARRSRAAVDDDVRRLLGADTYEKTRTALRRTLEHLAAAAVRARA
ncbi:MAG: helix-turn-helix transcriptional regulator [Labilithrix sp.]|nr:helix-turn-helix transcriptional regulator [Labilithrix sp.]